MIGAKFSGGFGKTLASLKSARDTVRKGEVARVLGRTARALAITGARLGVDPYGMRWPVSRVSGSPVTLGSIPYTLTATASMLSFTIYSTKRYAGVHQRGAVIVSKGAPMHFIVGKRDVFARRVVIPQRMFIPDGLRGLGNWRQPLQEAAHELVRKQFKT